jgi:hypothetical protein
MQIPETERSLSSRDCMSDPHFLRTERRDASKKTNEIKLI